MPLSIKRLLILAVAIVLVAGVDGALRGLRMPPAASTELSGRTQDLIAQARERQQGPTPQPSAEVPDPLPPQPSIIQTQSAPAEDPADGKGMTTADLFLGWEAGIIQIVDARPTSDHQDGHIPGAHSIPFEELSSGYPAALDLLDFEQPVVVYCDGGDCNASRNVASLLIDMGCQDVTVFERGLESWERAGHPVETGGGF